MKPAPAAARSLIAYFGTATAATTAASSVNPNASAFRGAKNSLQIQQAAVGKQHGRVLVIDFDPRGYANALFAARYCTTGVPLPKATSSNS